MISATFIGIFMVPGFYVCVRQMTDRMSKKPKAPRQG